MKGWFGEKKTAFAMWFSLDKNTYRRFHNVILPARDGTTQIDHLLISPFGVFIIETKNMQGWIFGSEKQPKWVQSIFGDNYPFQNPLRQTFRQKRILSEYLNLEERYIHDVVYFVGDCSFRTPMPKNVINYGLGKYVKNFTNQILSDNDVLQLTKKLEQHLSDSTLTNKDHVKSLRQRHSSTELCPKCGSKLVERTARSGANTGSQFLGCSKYPRCRFTRNI